MAYWLYKSEPSVYSYDDLERDGRTEWEGVRNFMARNYLRQAKVGDLVLFYHSNVRPQAIVGIAQVVREAYPDSSAWDPNDRKHFDPKSTEANPIWYMVDVAPVRKLPRPVTLEMVKATPALKDMVLVKSSRLSVQPVTEAEWKLVLEMAGDKG